MSVEMLNLCESRKVGRPAIYPQILAEMVGLLGRISARGTNTSIKLSSEAQLAKKFNVSRSLIRRAIEELRNEGRIVSQPGKGHYIAGASVGCVPSGIISVILGSTIPGGPLRDWNMVGVLDGIAQGFEGSPLRMVYEAIGPQQVSVAELLRPGLSELQGVILVPLGAQRVEEMVNAIPRGIKKVVLGRPSGHLNIPCVYEDHVEGICRAVRYLLSQGHKNIGYVRSTEIGSWAENIRQDAFVEEIQSHGINYEPEHILRITMDGNISEKVVAEILEKGKITALLVGSGALLSQILRKLNVAGIKIPDDLSVICFDDVPTGKDHVPAISCVREPLQELGRCASTLLMESLKGNDTVPITNVLGTELIVRDSVRQL